ncbi:hypothetical protein [Streptomyces sp. NPDC058373]|uniref:hypothetical protein n=1 Tax=Streptomyces sp. NPDC058373 TaxID=3346465 RepID=UPI003663297C
MIISAGRLGANMPRLRKNKKKTLILAAMALSSTVVISGCSADEEGSGDKTPTASVSRDGKEEGQKGSQAPPEAEENLAEVTSSSVTLTVTSAQRDSAGFLTVSGTVRNDTDGLWTGGDWLGDERELRRNGGSVAGASLIDKSAKKKYLVLRDTGGRCLCTKFEGGVKSGDSAEWFAQFPAPPGEVAEVDFQVGNMPPASIKLS